MPDFHLEDMYDGPVVGVDEVGRGPWAGPVLACAVVIDRKICPAEIMAGLDDSKKLTAKRREILYAGLTEHVEFALGWASVDEVDQVNILQASLLAMRRAVAGLSILPVAALVDGNKDPNLPMATQLVIKGDSISQSIAAASIIAKVTRDQFMTDLDQKFPGYGWSSNAGYGTKSHQQGLAALGVSPHHRRSFKPIAKLL